jgi:signal peptidase I
MALFRRRYEENTQLLSILKFISDVCIVIVFAYALVTFTCDRTTLNGNSMESSITSGDTVLINKMAYTLKSPSRYSVIAFQLHNTAGSKIYVKRVIGLPGETVQIKNGHVYINGALLEDDISDQNILTEGIVKSEVTLADDEYFVLGDSRNNSEDSRFASIGMIKEEDILGSAWMISAPFDHIGLVK